MLIETPRLTLRPLVESDIDDLFEYQSDPATVRYIPWPARTIEEVREAFLKYHALPDFSKDGHTALLGWELKGQGKIIGQSNFTFESHAHQKGVIGYVVHPNWAGQGYALEATRALIEYVFENFEVRRLTATIDPRNLKSVALIDRLGFRLEGTFLEDEFFKGEWVDTAMYAIRRSEYKKP